MNPKAEPISPAAVDAHGIRFPKIYAVLKWGIIVTLVVLAIMAMLFWTLVLGQFAGSGFHAAKRTGDAGEHPITPECAWPYRVNDHDARAVCRLFHNMTPEQQAQVLKKRGG